MPARTPNDATIVRTIIEMGRSLGIEVIAEGVESQAQLEFLRGSGCHYGQGRLFGEPCTAEDLLALLAHQARGTGAVRSPAAAHRRGRAALSLRPACLP